MAWSRWSRGSHRREVQQPSRRPNYCGKGCPRRGHRQSEGGQQQAWQACVEGSTSTVIHLIHKAVPHATKSRRNPAMVTPDIASAVVAGEVGDSVKVVRLANHAGYTAPRTPEVVAPINAGQCPANRSACHLGVCRRKPQPPLGSGPIKGMPPSPPRTPSHSRGEFGIGTPTCRAHRAEHRQLG